MEISIVPFFHAIFKWTLPSFFILMIVMVAVGNQNFFYIIEILLEGNKKTFHLFFNLLSRLDEAISSQTNRSVFVQTH